MGWCRRRLARVVAGGVMFVGAACAGSPPSFPSGTLGDDRGGTVGGAEGGDEDTETATSGIGGASGGLDETGPADSTGLPPGDSSGGSTSGPPMMGSTGEPEPPWFVGEYEGNWSGTCSGFPAPIGSIDGSGSWQVSVDEEGQITGEYDGSADYIGGIGGDITGIVEEDGTQTATATGPDLGPCDWNGQVNESTGSVSGDIHCPQYDCDGSFNGSRV